MVIKVNVLNGLNWINYTNWCRVNNFKKDNFRSLELYVNTHKSKQWEKLLKGGC